MNKFVFVLAIIASVNNINEAFVLLYNTENSIGMEEFNCIYLIKNSTIKYCIRHGQRLPKSEEFSNCSNGEQWKFSELLDEEISPSQILTWSSSVEKTDDYARIFYNRSENFNKDAYLCNCTQPGSFGKNCEYELIFDELLFSEAIQSAHEAKNITQGHQLWGDILCYETLKCDYGMLCLDWRNICDGQQNCMEGIDEENCDKLEFNECGEDEYRCVNGMCIPEEYWLDGQPDCMDGSDEMPDDGLSTKCALTPLVIDCDDRICPLHSWSCGDGQCILSFYRHIYQSFYPTGGTYCYSMREFNHMCETAVGKSLWTKPNGMCAEFGYKDDSIADLSGYNKCIYLTRCALSSGAEVECPCNGINCTVLLSINCMEFELLFYPRKGIIRPTIHHAYIRNRNWSYTEPDGHVLIGILQCRRLLIPISFDDNVAFEYDQTFITLPQTDALLCYSVIRMGLVLESETKQLETCWNDSFTFNGRPYAFYNICHPPDRCISQYRIRDGQFDCYGMADENLTEFKHTNHCYNIQKHRLQCSTEETTCLPASALGQIGTGNPNCENSYDKLIHGNGSVLTSISCTIYEENSECHQLRYYIGNSSIPNSSFVYTQDESNAQYYSTALPFRGYCDSFWHDHVTHYDENSTLCQQWVCKEHQFQCRTGQCIELNWVCDGEWDCSDASDEFGIFGNWSDHNERLLALNDRKMICLAQYKTLPFFDFCDFDYEYPCYRASVPRPLDIYTYRPCINLTQIGDGIEDCYGGLDEKNTFQDCQEQMLGYTLKCDSQCVNYLQACVIPICEMSVLCSYRNNTSEFCSKPNDVVCLNGTCAKNARCDKKHQCSHGEDEHWCMPSGSLTDSFIYRYRKQQYRWRSASIADIPNFPKGNIRPIPKTTKGDLLKSTPSLLSTRNHLRKDRRMNPRDVSSKNVEPQLDWRRYTCNQGFPIYLSSKNETHCICPPTYYGYKCQFFSDRLSVVTHLDLTEFWNLNETRLLTVVVTLHFLETIEDHYMFHVTPIFTTTKYVKQRFFLLYSRSNDSIKHKKWRYFNRTDIINQHPYSIQFTIYSLSDKRINELGSFHYPIYFDFLPAFRFSVVPKFPKWFGNSTADPCSNSSCNSNSLCKPLLNQNTTMFYCSCKSGYSGKNCEQYDAKCSSYCHNNSVCLSNSRGLIGNPDNPLCICPFSHFGPRCFLRSEACNSNPCGANSTCHLTYDPSGENSFFCVCPKNFYGDRCQYEKMSIHIVVNMTDSVAASLVQFYDYLLPRMILHLYNQQVFRGLPKTVRYIHGREQIPFMSILKIYKDMTKPAYFILYIQPNSTTIDRTSTPEWCPHATDLLSPNNISSISAVFSYHHICRNDPSRICFYDSDYFCICQEDSKRVHCFGHNTLVDTCDSCMSGGKCIKGDLKNPIDFVCLCRSCYQGELCEISLEAFGFTIDTLLNPRVAINSSIITLLIHLVMHIHELVYYRTVQGPHSSAVLCITDFHTNIVDTYNRTMTFIHHMAPFCVQIVTITLLIAFTARRRSKTTGKRMTFTRQLIKQFSTQKELYTMPTIIILSALPQIILTFSLACTELNGLKQHALLVAYLLSFAPQLLGFVLYVLPSSAYKKEFSETKIGKSFIKWM
ncbi:unnamed protein product [Rotaria socialis]|uniref:EGF-like domain-containing protein n=1 Tax=Rotaria socialis TaxID=392032 RepID=A0A820MH26_9BILA|nr:unnamed protein product [Rotaria socialis]CAF4472180.1 unnamed protein product [Rotaria socialis]